MGKGKDMYVDKITELAKMEYAYHLPLTKWRVTVQRRWKKK